MGHDGHLFDMAHLLIRQVSEKVGAAQQAKLGLRSDAWRTALHYSAFAPGLVA